MIRLVQLKDADRISELLAQMGYPNTESFMSSKISKLISGFFLIFEEELNSSF